MLLALLTTTVAEGYPVELGPSVSERKVSAALTALSALLEEEAVGSRGRTRGLEPEGMMLIVLLLVSVASRGVHEGLVFMFA